MMKRFKYILLGIILVCVCALCACQQPDGSSVIPPQQSEEGTENEGSQGGTESETPENVGESQDGGNEGNSSSGGSNGGFQGDLGEDEYAPNF